jgi:bifunctional non-homologous end joining protein LigD
VLCLIDCDRPEQELRRAYPLFWACLQTGKERGSRRRLGALLLGVYQGGELVYIGHTGTGFNERTLAEVRERLEPLLQKACPFPHRPKPNAAVHWVRPELICEVAFACWTDDGNMRHPSFKGMRDEIPATSVHREDGKDCVETTWLARP